jgi:hypothetical protein
MGFSNAVSVLSLVISVIALAITAFVSLRQVGLMRHANLLPAFVDLLQEFRSSDFYSHQDFILHELKNNSAEGGYSGLGSNERTSFLIMFDYLSSMACLVSFGIVTVYHVYATYGYVFQDMWTQMRPFIEKESELTGREIGFVVEDLCRKLSKVDYAAMIREMRIQPTSL